MITHWITVATLSILSALAAAEPDVKMANFTVNCKSWHLDNSMSHAISAACPDRDGNYQDSSLDLNQCYTYNQDHRLEVKVDGAAFDTCVSCQLEADPKKPPLLTCDCKIGGDKMAVWGHTLTANTTLDSNIFNRNGQLVCRSSVHDDQD